MAVLAKRVWETTLTLRHTNGREATLYALRAVTGRCLVGAYEERDGGRQYDEQVRSNHRTEADALNRLAEWVMVMDYSRAAGWTLVRATRKGNDCRIMDVTALWKARVGQAA